MYKPGGAIATALGRIQQKQYVLPAIQREFVWSGEQIERLFDSLMQGYPFGAFLFWKVEPETSNKFKFYDFVLNYHQRDAAHCPELPVLHNQAVTAVLDGQQRLTALNIGLRGSMATKLPNKWWNNPDAFPKRTLRINLLAPCDVDENGVMYRFRFLTGQQASRTEEALWFSVPEILGMGGGPQMLEWLIAQGLGGAELNQAYKILDRLHRVVHTEPLIHYYEEEAQDLERVLQIFIRLNSGGTVLSYSDLLLSIAVAQWEGDARTEIHSLVDEINRIGVGFDFSQDFVLKAGLMLADIASVGFKVENFTRENMTRLEAVWPAVRNALVRTVELVASFGFNGQNLRAESALLPIAYYLYARNAPDNYVTHGQYATDREIIRRWLASSLLKASGIWGSGLDTLLTALRAIIKESKLEVFPDDAIRQKMKTSGKSLEFESEEIDDLLSVSYGDKRVFTLLSLLFTFVDLRNQFHVDHVFPASRMTPARLKGLGFSQEKIEAIEKATNELPNLQLLEGPINNEKRAKLPLTWLEARYPLAGDRTYYCSIHLFGELPAGIEGAEVFWAARRELLRERIAEVLRVKASPS